MATVLDGPASALNQPATLHRNPSTTSVEIIDVDLLDDQPMPSFSTTTRTAPRQPPSRPTETISLLDSDDDDDVVVLPGARTRVRPRLFSPPPPVPSASSSRIPPIPPLPRGLSGFASLPSRRGTPTVTSPPVVRPNAQPFAFELAVGNAPPRAGPSNMHLHPNRHRRIPQNDLQPAPPSHHTPHMGFGGALLTYNRAQQRNVVAPLRRQTAENGEGRGGRIFGALQRMVQFFGRGGGDEQEGTRVQEYLMDHLFDDDDEEEFDHPARRFARHEMVIRAPFTPPVDYKPEYTHSAAPEPGFTFNFAPPDTALEDKSKEPPVVIDLVGDEDSPIAGLTTQPTAPPSPPAKVSTLLVCAHCLDPLVLGNGLVGDDARNRRVWALRCGHMIDGKCLDQIAVPETDKEAVADSIKGEGTEANMDRKGKGKAREVPESESQQHMQDEDHSIRWRLRSRGSVAMESVDPLPLPPSPVTTSLGKRKRNSTAKPKVQQMYEWLCPVQGCGRVHVSVKINDVWQQEGPSGPTITRKGKEKKYIVRPDAPGGRLGRGAIACFV